MLDEVAPLVEFGVAGDRPLAAAGDAGSRAPPRALAEAVAVVAFVGDQGTGFGQGTVAAPSLTCPSVSSMIRGLPSPSQTACSFESSLPRVRPIRRSPFRAGWLRSGELWVTSIITVARFSAARTSKMQVKTPANARSGCRASGRTRAARRAT